MYDGKVLESTFNTHLLDENTCGPPFPGLVESCRRRKVADEHKGHHGGNSKVAPQQSIAAAKSNLKVVAALEHDKSIFEPVQLVRTRQGAPTGLLMPHYW